MQRAQNGDREAFQTLFRDVGPLITAFVRRRISDASEVEDVCQETLLAIYESRHTYQPTRPIEPWLFAIAHNVSANYLRNRRSRASWQELMEYLPERADEGEASATLDLRQALNQLPQSQLEALKMTKA
jgi:RNA polymerase sigma-70 factor (ECF subfamily)